MSIILKDVKEATVKTIATCALAKAICREWEADHALIGLSFSYVIRGNTAMRFRTPDSVQREIVSFDRGSGFLPGNYHLGPVPKGNRLGEKRTKSSPRKTKRYVQRIHHKETLKIREAP